MADLLKLAERVERLDGPDREMDAEIMFDLYAKPVGEHKDDYGPTGYLWHENDPTWNFGLRFPGKDRAWFDEVRNRVDGETLLIERDGALVLMNALRIPKLTASLDAAMTLVPEGWSIDLMITENGRHSHVVLGRSHPINAIIRQDGPDQTLPITFCAAAIRARSNTQAKEA